MIGPERFIADILAGTDLVAIDVGASHFLPTNFHPLERVVTLCLFEPYEPAAEELRRKYAQLGLTNVKIFGDALADSNGVRTRRLADVLDEAGLPRADALKIDTQGAELLVLAGLGDGFSRDTLAVELEIGF